MMKRLLLLLSLLITFTAAQATQCIPFNQALNSKLDNLTPSISHTLDEAAPELSNLRRSYVQSQQLAQEFQGTLPRPSTLSAAGEQRIAQLEQELREIAGVSPTMQERALAASNSLGYSTDLSEAEYIEKIQKKINNLRRDINSPVITIQTRPLTTQTPLDVTRYSSMSQLETEFDILARRAAAPDANGIIHEVDAAFIAGGVPQRSFSVNDAGELVLGRPPAGDKVFAVGHQGAIDFSGELSNTGGERFYGLVFERGFVENYGVDFRNRANIRGGGGDTVPKAGAFNQNYAQDGNVFVVRGENATQELGQVHLQLGGGYTQMSIDGQITTQANWMQSQVRGVVEFDAEGNILRFIPRDE